MQVKTKKIVETTDCLNSGLSPNRSYIVVEIDDENYRVVNDRHEPVLYPKNLFLSVKLDIPKDWVRKDFEDGEYFIIPAAFESYSEYFYEDYFDGDMEAIKLFNDYLEEYKKREQSNLHHYSL